MKNPVLICSLIILLLCLSDQTNAQRNSLSKKNYSNYLYNINFRSINREQGLSDSYVQSILQDSKGFIWIGTLNGLHRYDGINFKIFRYSPDDPESLGSNGALSLFEDKSGTLWVGTNGGGVNKYNPELENFTRYRNQADSSNLANFISSLYEDSFGEFWVGSFYKGLSNFNPATGIFINYKNIPGDSTSLSDNRVWPIHEDSDGNIWVGTFHGGLNKFNREKKNFTRYFYDPYNPTSINNNVITWICGDSSGGIWVATVGGGINKIEYNALKEPVFTYIKKDHENPYSINDSCITSILIDQENILWAGTIQRGVNRTVNDIYSSDSLLFFSYNRSPGDNSGLTNNNVACMYKDNMGLLWIGTWGSGVCVNNTKQKQFRHFKHQPGDPFSISSNDITSMYEDNSGILWVGTRDGGLNKWDRKTNKFTHFKHNPDDPNSLSLDRVTAIYADHLNVLWVGAYNKGLNRLNRKKENFKTYTHDPLNKKSINYDAISSITGDRSGILWIGNEYDGLTRFDTRTGHFQYFRYDPENSNGLSSNSIYTLYMDSTGILWIGGGGLNIYDYSENKFINYQHNPNDPNSLSNDHVSKIFEDKSGTFWIGTFEGGLNKFDRKKEVFRCFRIEDGLPSNSINDILEDDHGNLWISTDEGLSKFSVENETFRNYDIEDGLQNIGMRGGYKSRTGEMIFGSSNGLIVFHPDSIKDNNHVPPVYITGFSLFNRPVPIGYDSLNKRVVLNQSTINSEQIELNYNENVFSIEFAALDFHAPAKNKYAYIMEGFDKNWIYTDAKRNFATYTNLNPGKYTFRVKGSNNDGIWNEAGTSINLIIHPPWWQTTWAYVFYILLITSIIYLTWKAQLRRIKIKHDYEMSRFEAQKLLEVDAIKSRFFTNVSHEFRTPLTLILGPTSDLIKEIKNKKIKNDLELIDRNARKLLGLVNQLMDISKLESGNMKLRTKPEDIVQLTKVLVQSFSSFAGRKKINLVFTAYDDHIIVYLDNDKFEKIMTNLLSNAFKFTPEGGKIEVKLKTEAGNLEIHLSDTGIGIPESNLPKIFDRFYQVDGRYTREQEGTGIGLAFTNELVQLHKGSIKILSEEGRGTTFIISLPLGKNHLKQDEICDELNSSPAEENYKKKFIEEESFYGNENKSGIDDFSIDSKPVLLLIEDNRDVRKYISDKLQDEFTILEAVDGEDGWCKSVKHNPAPDLIVSDVMMPKIDGLQLCEKLKSDERTSHIPVILLTAKAAKEDKLQGYETGADDYIKKPFEPDILKARIKNLLEQRKRVHEHFRKTGIFEFDDQKIIPADKKFLQKAFEIILNNVSNHSFGVDILSDGLNVSRSVLHRKLVSLTGESPGDLIRRIRIKKASQLIEQKFGNISEIALEVGFNNPSQFSRSFYKQFGMSPSDYQRSKCSL